MPSENGQWDYSLFWKEALNQIKAEIEAQEFTMWFNMDYDSSDEGAVKVCVPSPFYRDQVTQRYLPLLEGKLHELSGRDIKVDFLIRKKTANQGKAEEKGHSHSHAAPALSDSSAKKTPLRHEKLKPEYSFDNYIIGENNAFAANAAMAIAKNPGTTYNPCLIYGGVGLGKTHLMQAIGNFIWATGEKKRVICITAEEFTNEFVQSIKDNSTNSFKNKYRHADILLIDDIHFFQGKKETQEELFHTFNALYDSNKQLVFTCDRPVSEFKEFSDRLRSRFERGLNVDLQPPNYETRLAILNQKVERSRLSIPLEVLEIIAKNISSNVRDLEAALLKLAAYADLVKNQITVEIAQQLLKDMFSQSRQGNITVDSIQRVVAEYFNVSVSDLKGKKKTKIVTLPRQMAMYITRTITELSTTEIGVEFGGRDHTTVMHACEKIEDKKKLDPAIDNTIQRLVRGVKEYSTKA